jgi:hypothetical protein
VVCGHCAANDDKNVPEQRTVTIDNTGYEEAFEDVNRSNVESVSEMIKSLQIALKTDNMNRVKM